MIVTLDGDRIEAPLAAGCTLGQLVDQLRADFEGDRLIVAIDINGQRLVEATAEALLARPLGADDQVDVETGHAESIVADALRELAAALLDAGQAAPTVATRLNTGDIAGGMRDVAELVTVWQNGRMAVGQAGNLLRRDLAEIVADDRTVDQHLQALVGKLTEIRDAMVASDMVLVADLLHYEMPAMCETWSRVLNSVADAVADEAAVR